MGRSLKTKKVSWASDLNLCQIRLFSLEESPSRVALGTQDHLKEKTKWPIDNEADDSLPPGFEGIQSANLLRVKLPQIPLIKWRCPLRIDVNTEWRVVAGEESTEMKAQSQREMGVLEAAYPRPSSIPMNPIGFLDVKNSMEDHENIPVVPITPIEEDDAVMDDTSFSSPALNLKPMISPPQILTHENGISKAVAEVNILTATASLLSKCDMEKLVDHDLLVQILSDPKLLDQLIKNHGLSSPNVLNVTSVGEKKVENFDARNLPSNVHNLPYNHTTRPKPTNNAVNRIEHHTTSAVVTSSGPLYHTSPANGHMKKDVNYYKNLIQEHGNEKEECLSGQEHKRSDFGKSRELKSKIKKPCIFFNSRKGCRNGVYCTFQHVLSIRKALDGFTEGFSAKRVKLGEGVAGR